MLNFEIWKFVYCLEFLENSGDIGLNSFLLVLAAITRRAQIQFSSRLFAVMAVPTPVSLLLRSSTLVTAGFVPSWTGVSLFYVRMEREPLAET
jgi:NADH-ubiquinone oxidoreductase chain 5